MLKFLYPFISGIIYTFNVEMDKNLAKDARAKGVQCRSFNVIYKLIDDLKSVLTSKLPTSSEEVTIGIQ